MNIFDGHRPYEKARNGVKTPAVVTIGNFDGMHRGHRAILQAVVLRAQREKMTSLVYTFTPHPRSVLLPESKIEQIYSYEERRELAKGLGVQVFVDEPFSRDFSQLEARDFFDRVLVKALDTRILYIGHDFGFGRGRSGSHELLKELCLQHGIELRQAAPLKIDSQICSSTNIRALLKEGKVDEAERFLGTKYFLRGQVVQGDGRGKKIGFPTANLKPSRHPILMPGVYCNEATVAGMTYQAVTNIGTRPTFHGEGAVQTVESHLLDFSQDIYGQPMELRFVGYLRNEKKFSGVEELKHQIYEDIRQARRRFFLD